MSKSTVRFDGHPLGATDADGSLTLKWPLGYFTDYVQF